MNQHYDTSKLDVNALGLEAACQKAYEDGLREGACGACQGAFSAGLYAGGSILARMYAESATVVDGWFHGDNTVLLFADGEKEKVTFRHEPGCEYDREKAVMACILKHAAGNSYIAALRLLEGKRRTGVPGKGACAAICAAEDDEYFDGACAEDFETGDASGLGPVCMDEHDEGTWTPEDAIPCWNEEEVRLLEERWSADDAILCGRGAEDEGELSGGAPIEQEEDGEAAADGLAACGEE